MRGFDRLMFRLSITLVSASTVAAAFFGPIHAYTFGWTLVISGPFVAAGLLIWIVARRCGANAQFTYDRSAQNLETVRRLEELAFVRTYSPTHSGSKNLA